MIEEQRNYDELFTEQKFEEESKEYYDEYAVNPALAFPRPIVIYQIYKFEKMNTSNCFFSLKYDSTFDESPSQSTKTTSSVKPSEKVRVQDAELQKMSDPGKCLSMHQPYASLLVAGIKKY